MRNESNLRETFDGPKGKFFSRREGYEVFTSDRSITVIPGFEKVPLKTLQRLPS